MASTQIKTHMLHCNYHNATTGRTEFRLPSKVLLNTWRLSAVGALPSEDVEYVRNLGVGGLIKHIHLYAGKVPVEEVREAHRWVAFESLRNSTLANVDKEPDLTGVSLGYELGGVETDSEVQTIKLANPDGSRVFADVGTAASQIAGTLGTFSLNKVLHYLRYDDLIPCNLVDMRLVIEWRMNDAAYVFQSDSGAITYTMREPVLFVDEVVDPRVVKKVSGGASIPYFVMERDTIVIPAAGDGLVQKNLIRFNNFKNKSVRRMLLINNPNIVPDNDTSFIKDDCSATQHQQKINFRVNGREYFPFNGVNQENKALDMTASAWGSLDLANGLQWDGLHGAPNFLVGLVDSYELVGKFSYFGFNLNERVDDIDIIYERTGRGAAESNQRAAFTMMIYGEVARVLTIKNGQAVVSYA